MKRVYYHYEKWEDFRNGLYDIEKEYTEKEQETLTRQCKDFLSSNEFEKIGTNVIHEWVFASEQNLSNINRNRRAWIGQASCCYKFKVPERIIKYAWRLLTIKQQNKANLIADKLISMWEKEYAKKISKEKCLESF